MQFDSSDDALWSRINVGAPNACWPWTGYVGDNGYGTYSGLYVHRIAFRAANRSGPWPEVVRHTCDNPICCNPAHLIAGTHADNVADRVSRDRSAKGSRNGRAKLNEAQAAAIYAAQGTQVTIARSFGVSDRTVRKIKAGQIWKHACGT